jgi:hypothetical protein
VCFVSRSYLHCKWLTADELKKVDKRFGQKLKTFRKDNPTGTIQDKDEYFNPDYLNVHRVLCKSVTEVKGKAVTHYLVKWRGLPYKDSTWELEAAVDENKVSDREGNLWCCMPHPVLFF